LCFRMLNENEIEVDNEEVQPDHDNNMLPMPIEVEYVDGAAGGDVELYVCNY